MAERDAEVVVGGVPSQETLKQLVYSALDNAKENGYEIEDEFSEAQDLLDQSQEIAQHYGIEGELPNQNDPSHVREVMKLVKEWKEEKLK